MDIKEEIKKINANPYLYGYETKLRTLEMVLRKLSHHYYNTGKPLVLDSVFDSLKEILEERDPTNDFLSEVGAAVTKKKVKLPHWLGSLDKITPDTEALGKWQNDYTGPYLCSDKLDGVSALLTKVKGKLKMYTRGNGLYGVDISHLIPFVLSRKIRDNKDLVDGMAIRGELIISKENFKKIEDKYANGRNAVAGLVNSKRYSVTIADLTDFVAYSLYHPPMKISLQMKKLKKLHFMVVYHKSHKTLSNNKLSQSLIKRRKISEYEIDGIVVADDKKYPVSGGNPRSAFAFKAVLSDQMAEVKVTQVNWEISMTSRLVPTVSVEPVRLVGVEIKAATAHNAKFIVDHKLGPGATIKLIRSKDVIPYILDVIEPAPSGKPSLPPYKYKWSKTKVDLYLDDPKEFEIVVVKQITQFFKMLDVKHISQATVQKIVDQGYNEIPKIIKKIQKQDKKLLMVDGLGEKMLTRISREIDRCWSRAYLYHLMAGSRLFGFGLGPEKLKLITQRLPDIMEVKDSKGTLMEKLIAIDGIEMITADKFVSGLADFKKFYKKLGKVVDLSQLRKFSTNHNGVFKDQKVVFTGFRDKELKEFIENAGGKVSSTVTSKTTMVVYTDTSSSKYKKALEKGVEMYAYDAFLDKFYKK